MNDTEYAVVKKTVKRLLDIDLENYKRDQMERRVASFMRRHFDGTALAFCRALEHDHALLAELENMLTINVTEFFRDPVAFDLLRRDVFPRLLGTTPALKVWSAGCSRGTEAYSVAILLDSIAPGGQHRVIATDIDRRVLAIARAGGPYREAELKNVPAHLRERYFRSSVEDYYILPPLKRYVHCMEHDLLTESFPSGFHVILCRNVMIYFTREARVSLIQRFRKALVPGGALVLGRSEALLIARSEGFERVGPSMYRRTDDAGAPSARLARTGTD